MLLPMPRSVLKSITSISANTTTRAAPLRAARLIGTLVLAVAGATAWAAGPAESAAEQVASRILANRCGTQALNLGTSEADPICHRTLAPGDSGRLMQRAERDRGLLAAYRDLDSLFAMRDRQIADINAQVELARRRMVALHHELERLRRRAQAQGGPQASDWMEQARMRATAILAEQELIHGHETEQARIRAQFDRDARRLRLLLSTLEANPGHHLAVPGRALASSIAATANSIPAPVAKASAMLPQESDGPLAHR